MIKAGSFLKANGGYLVINALDALVEAGVWATLKRTLRNQIFEIQNYLSMYFFSGPRIKPEPVKCDVKVVMIGDAYIYNLLYFQDEDFKKIFKIKAEFDSEMPKDADGHRRLRPLHQEDLRRGRARSPSTRTASPPSSSTRPASPGARKSSRRGSTSSPTSSASRATGPGKGGRTSVGRADVDKAVEERFERVSLIEDKIQEMIEDGTIMIDTEGAVVGQVNGLSVYDMGQFMLRQAGADHGPDVHGPRRRHQHRAGGRPERPDAQQGRPHPRRLSPGEIRDQDKPFALSASLAFEQSYGGVDGDSASSTEVYAILSSLSGLPLRQDIAVTGSLNQKGEIQPIGGVNEKIEGFFDVCRAKGLTGTQGVIIPHQNVQNLMLRADVVDAVKARGSSTSTPSRRSTRASRS